jgi:hypothetical protein
VRREKGGVRRAAREKGGDRKEGGREEVTAGLD